MIKTNISKVLLVILLAATVGMIGYLVSSQLGDQRVFIPPVKDLAFLATNEGKVLQITLFDPAKQETIVSKKIELVDYLTSSSSEASGANDAVQFNPVTQEIFFATSGVSDYDGGCINQDGTCLSRLYKMNLETMKPAVFFESEQPFTNWLVNSFDNSLLLSFPGEQGYELKKISGQTGQVLLAEKYQVGGHERVDELELSVDGKYTYQASLERVTGDRTEEILRLRKINNAHGQTEVREVFRGTGVEYGTYVSPDDSHLAFYAGTFGSPKLYMYSLKTKQVKELPYEGSIHNYSLLWSGDSSKLLHLPKVGPSYFDLTTNQDGLFLGAPQKARYVYAWGPSTNFMMYKVESGAVKIVDLRSNQVSSPLADNKPSSVKGASWY